MLTDDLLIFETLAHAESWIEPVDVSPDDRAWDAEGRALSVRVRGEIKRGWIAIDQHKARVEIVATEDDPTHAEELRTELVAWLGQVEGSTPTGTLAELVQRARRYAVR